MSLLFSDVQLGVNEDSFVTYGNEQDVCLLTYREEMLNRPMSEAVEVRKSLEGKLHRKLVLKFKNSGAQIVISMDYIHKLAEKYPQDKNNATDADKSEGNEE